MLEVGQGPPVCRAWGLSVSHHGIEAMSRLLRVSMGGPAAATAASHLWQNQGWQLEAELEIPVRTGVWCVVVVCGVCVCVCLTYLSGMEHCGQGHFPPCPLPTLASVLEGPILPSGGPAHCCALLRAARRRGHDSDGDIVKCCPGMPYMCLLAVPSPPCCPGCRALGRVRKAPTPALPGSSEAWRMPMKVCCHLGQYTRAWLVSVVCDRSCSWGWGIGLRGGDPWEGDSPGRGQG